VTPVVVYDTLLLVAIHFIVLHIFRSNLFIHMYYEIRLL